MRAEDKRIGVDRDEEEVEQRKRLDRAHESELLLETGDDRAEVAVGPDVSAEHYERTLAVVCSIFHEDTRPLDGLTGFSGAEMEALKYLEAAVSGRDAKLTHLVYAADRRDLLEQALAVLYPTMSQGLSPELGAFREHHDELVSRVTELRDQLVDLEDAQDELLEKLGEGQEKVETKEDDEEDGDGDEQADGEAADAGDADADAEDGGVDVAVGDPGMKP